MIEQSPDEINWSVLLPGLPVTSPRGALGWSSVTLVQSSEQNILVDTGSYGDRQQLVKALGRAGLSPDAIDAVVLTHFHYDHVLNYDLFNKARFFISKSELTYVTSGDYLTASDPYVPAVVFPLIESRLTVFTGEEELFPGIRTIPLPGHTPGQSGLLLEKEGVLIAGDGIKSGFDFVKNLPPPLFAPGKDALACYRYAEKIARIIIPGHDQPFSLPVVGKLEYLEEYGLELSYAGNPENELQNIRLAR